MSKGGKSHSNGLSLAIIVVLFLFGLLFLCIFATTVGNWLDPKPASFQPQKDLLIEDSVSIPLDYSVSLVQKLYPASSNIVSAFEYIKVGYDVGKTLGFHNVGFYVADQGAVGFLLGKDLLQVIKYKNFFVAQQATFSGITAKAYHDEEKGYYLYIIGTNEDIVKRLEQKFNVVPRPIR